MQVSLNINKLNFKSLTPQAERDNICMLLDYALIHKNWQGSEKDVFIKSFELPRNDTGSFTEYERLQKKLNLRPKEYRGYNIGALILSPENEIVITGLNSVCKDSDSTRHAEMNAIQDFFKKHPEAHGQLKGYTVYTSLEPCTMCTGAMFQSNVSRVVYGMEDKEFGGVAKRLISPDNGKYLFYRTKHNNFCMQEAADKISQSVRKLFNETGKQFPTIIEWLESNSFKQIIKTASEELMSYNVKFAENKKLLDKAVAILKK